jgi:hypothetical protein
MVHRSNSLSPNTFPTLDGSLQSRSSNRRSYLNDEMVARPGRRLSFTPFVHFATPLIFGASTALLWNVEVDSRSQYETSGSKDL